MKEPKLSDFNISKEDVEWYQRTSKKLQIYYDSFWTKQFLKSVEGVPFGPVLKWWFRGEVEEAQDRLKELQTAFFKFNEEAG